MVWKYKNERGDGSCFFRAIFNAAKNHHDGSLVKNIYDCFGLKGKLDDEEEFVDKLRNSLSNKIKNGIYDMMANSQRQNVLENKSIHRNEKRMEKFEEILPLYEQFQSLAKQKLSNEDDEFYDLAVNEQAHEFIDKFKDPNVMMKISKDDFYNFLGNIMLKKTTYAAQTDIDLVKWILDHCESKILLNMHDGHGELFREKNGVKVLNIRRVNENHYWSYYEVKDKSNLSEKLSKMSVKNVKPETKEEKILRLLFELKDLLDEKDILRIAIDAKINKLMKGGKAHKNKTRKLRRRNAK